MTTVVGYLDVCCTVSLYVMGRWVESSTLATPTQQALAKQVSRECV